MWHPRGNHRWQRHVSEYDSERRTNRDRFNVPCAAHRSHDQWCLAMMCSRIWSATHVWTYSLVGPAVSITAEFPRTVQTRCTSQSEKGKPTLWRFVAKSCKDQAILNAFIRIASGKIGLKVDISTLLFRSVLTLRRLLKCEELGILVNFITGDHVAVGK